MGSPVVLVACATRSSEAEFWRSSALGLSLVRLADPRLVPDVAFENREPLARVYNRALRHAPAGSTVVFVHDDLFLLDTFFADAVIAATAEFDVVGVAGNRRRVAGQPAWVFPDMTLAKDDDQHLSGAAACGPFPFSPVCRYGTAPAACELLDGVLLAGRADVWNRAGLRFDEQFAFHFYDMDLCRSARRLGLKLGTWPISVTHKSEGAFGTPAWLAALGLYREKWGD
jgi:GT2 family glycosyltransferase